MDGPSRVFGFSAVATYRLPFYSTAAVSFLALPEQLCTKAFCHLQEAPVQRKEVCTEQRFRKFGRRNPLCRSVTPCTHVQLQLDAHL
jgi:hypothetical protein